MPEGQPRDRSALVASARMLEIHRKTAWPPDLLVKFGGDAATKINVIGPLAVKANSFDDSPWSRSKPTPVDQKQPDGPDAQEYQGRRLGDRRRHAARAVRLEDRVRTV